MISHIIGLLSCTVGLYLASFLATVLFYVYYTHSEESSCHLNKFFISFNMILALISTVAAVHPRVQEANTTSGVLQAGVVIFYCTYLTWSSLSNRSGGAVRHHRSVTPWNRLVGNAYVSVFSSDRVRLLLSCRRE